MLYGFDPPQNWFCQVTIMEPKSTLTLLLESSRQFLSYIINDPIIATQSSFAGPLRPLCLVCCLKIVFTILAEDMLIK